MTNGFYPLVSIVIPVYNGSQYMSEAIDSALAQTYKNIEVLVINDGSNDNGASREIALSYGNKIKYYEKENGGVATALNLGVEMMKGDYFSWLSHDDIYYPDKIEKQVWLLKNTDKSLIIYSDYEYFSISSLIKINYNKLYSEVLKEGYYALLFNFIHGCTLLIPKKCFENVGVFNNDLKTTNDYDLFFRLIKYYKFEYLDLKLVIVRLHSVQDSMIKRECHYQECNMLWMQFIKSLSSDEILKLEKYLFIFYQKVLNYLKYSPYVEAFEYVKNKLYCSYVNNKFMFYFYTNIPLISGIYFNSHWYIRIKKILAIIQKLFFTNKVAIKQN